MTRFDFLRDARPPFVERLAPRRLPPRVRTALCALLTSVVIVSLWWGFEISHVRAAQRDVAVERMRAAQSRADVARVRIRRAEVVRMLALDARMRAIRRSGAVFSAHLASIGNGVPDSAWLTAASLSPASADVSGATVGLDGLANTLRSLIATRELHALTLVNAAREERTAPHGLVHFGVRAAEAP
jgi:hypothetical protein